MVLVSIDNESADVSELQKIEDNMLVSVNEICGAICVQPKLGESLRSKILSALKSNESLEVSFEGVGMLTTSFLNVAVGSLYGNDTLNQTTVDSINWSGLDESDTSLLKLVIENAKRFYSLSDDQQSTIIENSDGIKD